MTGRLRSSLLLISFTLIAACASDSRITSDFDDSLDFSAYRTFNFSSPTEVENPDFPENLRLHYSAAIEQQMLERGYTRANYPDIVIDVSVALKDMTSAPKVATRNLRTRRPMYPHSTAATACPDSGDYNGQVGRSSSSAGSLSTLCKFKEGSIKVDMMDADLRQTIWTGMLHIRIDDNEKSYYLIQNIVNDTSLMFESSPFPVRQQLSG